MTSTDPFADVNPSDGEADADGAEVKDAIDETGTLLITD
jgi:hypothetical protein